MCDSFVQTPTCTLVHNFSVKVVNVAAPRKVLLEGIDSDGTLMTFTA